MSKPVKKKGLLSKPLSDGGYKPGFLGKKFRIPFPELNDTQKADLIKYPGGKFRLDYIHFSLVM